MELTINNLIKLILGVLVFAVVIGGVYLFFKNNVIDFFKSFSYNSTNKLFFGLLKVSPPPHPGNLICSSLLLVGFMNALLLEEPKYG